MGSTKQPQWSRRERQIMEILIQKGKATAAEVQESMADAPSYSAVRALMRILEEKGHLRHEEDGPRYIFYPTVAPDRARKSAVKQLLHTFFNDSAEEAFAALLDASASSLRNDELDRLAAMIEKARKEGR